MVNYYDTLKVSPKASNAEIKSAYRRLARKLHPDKNAGSEETARAFAKIAEAYEVLGNPKERAVYDKQILQAKYNGNGNGDSVFASENSHARRWRQLVYEHRYNEIINRMIADERRESMALQKIIFPTVALFMSVLAVSMFKPVAFTNMNILGKIILLSLFAAGLIHLIGRLREGLQRFTYDDADLHDSILDDREVVQKPYSRVFAAGFLIAGILVCIALGLIFSNYVGFIANQMPETFSRNLHPEAFLYPPIFVLFVDLIHVFALRVDG